MSRHAATTTAATDHPLVAVGHPAVLGHLDTGGDGLSVVVRRQRLVVSPRAGGLDLLLQRRRG